MANWWDAAPLAEQKTAPEPSAGPAAGANWWDAAPVVHGGMSAPEMVPGKDGAPTRVIMDMSKKPDRGVLDAGARGVAQGLTANFGDEIRGLVEASGANPDDPASLTKLIHGALKYWGGDAEAKTKYEETVKRERELNKTAEEQHPVASTVGNIAGAVALPIGAAGQAATLPGRMAAGAGVGGVLGGLAGAGEGEGVIDRIARGATGAAVGGALGGAAPAVIEGVVQGGRKLAEPIANTIRGFRDPEAEAGRRVATALQRDMQADPNAVSRLTPQEFAASAQSGGPATNMDLGGETTRALARSAANTSPEGRAALGRTIDERFEGQSGRVTDWLRKTFHFPDADAQGAALENVAKTTNRARYLKANREGDKEIFSPELDRLMGSPAVVDAMRKASTSGKDRAITEGLGAMRQGVTVENGVVSFTKGPSGVPTYPNLAFWDATKRELDDAANAAARSGRKAEASTLGDLAKSLRNELDVHVPSYKDARAGAASFFGAEDALDAGRKFAGNAMSAAEGRRGLAKMTPQERQLFQDGFVSDYVDMLNKVGDRRSILNKIGNSPAAREKLNVALGPQKAAELEAEMRVEGIMDLARNAVQGNSTTARQLAELGLAGGTYGFSGGGMNPLTNPGAVMSAALAYGAAKGHGKINENVSRKVAELLTSADPTMVTRGIQLVINNKALFGSLRSADKGIARVGGEQAGGVPAIAGPQAMSPAAAQENGPPVPGPTN